MFRKWFASRNQFRTRVARNTQPQLEVLEDRTVPVSLVGLTTNQQLLFFDSATPSQTTQSPTITGLSSNLENIVDIDARPSNGVIYGLSDLNFIYTIDPSSAVATRVGNTPAGFDQIGKEVSIDFNPTVDLLRVMTNAEQNYRANPIDGTLFDSDGNAGNGTQPDTPLAYANNANPEIVGIAYDRNFQGTTLTTAFGIDTAKSRLVRIGGVDSAPPASGGVLNTIGNLGITVTKRVGFDIAANGTAFASFVNASGVSRLYTINLGTGAATSLGKIGNGSVRLRGLTESPRDEIIFATTQSNKLVSFKANDPNTLLTSRAISCLLMGETISAIDFRPATGQLFALTAFNRVLLIDTNSGVALQVGSPIDVALFTPNPQANLEFAPQVDQLRLINPDTDNLRFSPVTFTPVDSDGNPGNGIQPDSLLTYDAGDPNSAAVPNIAGIAYDRNDNDGLSPTTLWAIDSVLNNLVTIGGPDSMPSPGGGLVFTAGAATMNLGVDPTDLVGFDIIDIGKNGNGAALAVMQLTGDTVSKLFAINLSAGLMLQPQGTATLIGTVGGGELITAMAIAPPKIQFSATTYTVKENGGTARIALTRTGGSGHTATVTLNTSDGTAVAPGDYTAVSNLVVTFLPGETTKFVDVPILVNNGSEPAETVNLTLSAVTGGSAVLGIPATATLTITEAS